MYIIYYTFQTIATIKYQTEHWNVNYSQWTASDSAVNVMKKYLDNIEESWSSLNR